jgi:glycosyltransferase involved in cell wall biosynthesis
MSCLRICLVSTAAPDRLDGSMVRYGRMVRDALEQVAGDDLQVEELNLAPSQAWLRRFPATLRTPIRYAAIAAAARRRLPHVQEGLLHLLDGSHAYLLDAAGPLSVPVVSTVHDLIPALRLRGEPGMPPLGRGGAWLIQRTLSGLKRADAWVADSGSTRDDVVRLVEAPTDRVHVVHPAVTPVEPSALAVPDPSAVPVVLHVAGNNTFYKNRAGVIDVFKSIYQSIDVVLKMVGAPPDAALRAKAKHSGVASAIEFCPHVSESELAALYRSAAFFLFPSLYEGFGWPPLEAMAQGCPVVCSNTGSLPEVVGDAALMASPDDIHGLASHGLRLLRDPPFRARLTERGHQQARRFSMEALAAGLLATYRSVEAGS